MPLGTSFPQEHASRPGAPQGSLPNDHKSLVQGHLTRESGPSSPLEKEGAMDMRRAHCESGCSVVLLVGVVCKRVFRGDMRVGVVGVGRDLDCGVIDRPGVPA